MATSSEMAAFDRGLRPLMEIVLPERAEAVIGLQAEPELQERIDELAEKSATTTGGVHQRLTLGRVMI